ncbi:LysM peptidoglycan-binding domain-containing M23 family metallopeptidase [Shimia sp. FJ5]|uniref:LysM peptidoglycan-binding domain-containing M23 family metallopeptidase n=1 Tax=Shimia sp. FJ5 TaxID=3079054 RepID=UPI002608DCCE|nr:LysM peptidoglycan-binding domain-containing M23 family metallopeptidase [Shimia sp. FJ5]MDV4143938.1 LysM peptidoglycan-binding domain-containing M23 family metallopeptidase [Shimia sp. FJ5]
MTRHSKAPPARLMMMGLTLVLVGACNDGFDFDLRGGIGAGLDTTTAAKAATADRPRPDKRGIISYPNYQVAVARRGDSLDDVATRIDMPAADLARYNGLRPEDQLRAGEIIALPYRVAEPSPATGGRGVVTPPSGVDITAMADSALSDAETRRVATEPLQPAPSNAPKGETGLEPIRHKVRRGETAFTIARLYDVTPRALAEWNGLGSDFMIRENQILLIPPAAIGAPDRSTAQEAAAAPAVTAPGGNTPTPTPPSARQPLPDPDKAVEAPEAPDLGKTQTARSSRMGYPVDGKIIRPYARGKNNGIDIAAAAGTPVQAARDGKVAAITTDADNVRIVVLRHDSNLMTVYYNVDDVTVSKGANVKRGQSIAAIPAKDSFVHFEVRKGFDSVDPMPYLK